MIINSRIIAKHADTVRTLISRRHLILDEDLFVGLFIGMVVESKLTQYLALLREIAEHNPERKRRHLLNLKRMFIGSTYLHDCYSMAEVAIDYFDRGLPYLIEQYDRVVAKERVRAGQILYCAACERHMTYLGKYKSIAEGQLDAFNTNNALYALANLPLPVDCDFIVRFLSWRPYYRAAVHILGRSNLSGNDFLLIRRRYEELSKMRKQRGILPMIKDILDREGSTPNRLQRFSPILSRPLPLGLVRPDMPMNVDLEELEGR